MGNRDLWYEGTGDYYSGSPLVSGVGDTHNNLFQIVCGQLQTNTILDTQVYG